MGAALIKETRCLHSTLLQSDQIITEGEKKKPHKANLQDQNQKANKKGQNCYKQETRCTILKLRWTEPKCLMIRFVLATQTDVFRKMTKVEEQILLQLSLYPDLLLASRLRKHQNTARSRTLLYSRHMYSRDLICLLHVRTQARKLAHCMLKITGWSRTQ